MIEDAQDRLAGFQSGRSECFPLRKHTRRIRVAVCSQPEEEYEYTSILVVVKTESYCSLSNRQVHCQVDYVFLVLCIYEVAYVVMSYFVLVVH